MATVGQVWVTGSEGGYLTNNKFSKSLRVQNEPEWVFRQFVNIKEDLGKKSGDTVFFDKTLKIDTKGTTIAETATIPENKWKVIKDSVTVTEYGNSTPYTEKLQTLAEFDPEDISSRVLKQDMLEVIDSAVAEQFDAADFTAVCTNTATTTFNTSSAYAATAACNMSDKNVRDIVDYMETRNIPKFADKNYRAILSVNSRRGIYDYLQAVAQYTEPSFRHNAEVGQYYGCRFTLDNSYLSNTIGSTTNAIYGEAFFFGQEAVLEAVAQVEEVRMKIPTDYGRSKGVAWYFIGAWKKMWDQSTDDLNSTGSGIERIIRVGSQ